MGEARFASIPVIVNKLSSGLFFITLNASHKFLLSSNTLSYNIHPVAAKNSSENEGSILLLKIKSKRFIAQAIP